MPLSLVSNISSANAIRRLSSVTADLSRIQEHLSSGLRIAQPNDDAAGLAISKSLSADATVYSQGLRNVNDAIGLLNTAEGAVSQLSSIVTRQRELAEQAANGVYSGGQRAALNAEANALVNEYNRIVRATAFNGLNVIDGVSDSFNAQQGYGISEQTLISVAQSLGTASGTGQFTSQSVDVLGIAVTAVGDINGDGNQDLVTFDTGSTTAFLISGSSTGTFNNAVTTPFGIQASAVRLADLDNDGDLDIVATSSASDRVYVLRGNGNGTFLAAVSFTIPGGSLNPADVQIKDLNGDGNLDIVTANFNADGRIGVYLGNGDTTFRSGVDYYISAAAITPSSICVTDFNGDGIMDVAVGESSPSATYILLGNSDGTFKAARSYGIGGKDIDYADFNGDGIIDLVGVRGTAAYVGIGNGDGTFVAPINLTIAGTTLVSVVTGDFNGDGRTDFAAADSSGASILTFLGNGNGTFLAPLSTSNTAPNNLSTGDFNRDGVTDLISDRNAGTDRISVLLGTTDSTGRRNNFQYNLDLLTINSARDALTTLSNCQDRINVELGRIGAFQSRLSSAVNNLENRRVNYRAAQSLIEDVDVADEAAQLVSRKILQQSASAVLAQANQQPKIALTLLGKTSG